MFQRWVFFAVSVLALVVGGASASAAIDMEWRPAFQTVCVGDTVYLDLYLVSDDDEVAQELVTVFAVLAWTHPESLVLRRYYEHQDMPDGIQWLVSTFHGSDPENVVYCDGDAAYVALNNPMLDFPEATPEGVVATRLKFKAEAVTPPGDPAFLEFLTEWYDVALPELADLVSTMSGPEVDPPVACRNMDLDEDGDVDLADMATLQIAFGVLSPHSTHVLGTSYPGQDVTGTLGTATVEILEEGCSRD